MKVLFTGAELNQSSFYLPVKKTLIEFTYLSEVYIAYLRPTLHT